MEILNNFNPRLVDPVLIGTTDKYSEAILYLFSDHPIAINIRLRENSMPYKLCEKRVRIPGMKNNFISYILFFYRTDLRCPDHLP